MHPLISDFPSRHFYGGQVTTGVRSSDRPIPVGFPWPSASTPVAFVRISDRSTSVISGGGDNLKDETVSTSERADPLDTSRDHDGRPRGGGGGQARGTRARGRGQLEMKGGTEFAPGGRGGAAAVGFGTSYSNRREADAVAFALEMIVAAGDVEVRE